jgi:hypothetical protein
MRRSLPLPAVCSLIAGPILFGLPAAGFQAPQTAAAKPAEVAPAAKPAEKPILVYKAKAGESARYKTTGAIAMEAAGNKVNIEMTEVEKVAFTAVAPSGDITMERETESSEQTVNGQKMPSDEEKTKYTVVIKPNGALVSHKSDKSEPEQSKLQARMYSATTPIFTDKPVGVGDKWTYDFVANSDTGARAGHAEYEVLAFEKVSDVDTVKVKGIYTEGGSSPAMRSTCTYWVERTSGDTVKSDLEVENIAFGEGPQSPVGNGKLHQERISGAPLGGGKAAEAKKDKDIDETVKEGFEKLPGIFTLYRKRESGRDTLYMEVKESQLDKLMMLETTASTGSSDVVVAGAPLDDLVFKLSKVDDRIFITVPNINFRVKEKTPLDRAMKRSFADGYIEAYKIEAKQASRKSLLINVSDLFRGDIAQINAQLRGFSPDRDKTYIASIKNFPENLVVETAYHFTGSRSSNPLAAILGGGGSAALADSRSLPFKVNYTLFFLPENGYKPRVADPRVGFFTTDFQSFDDDSKDDQTTRYIYRWDMEKADPKLAMSPPKKPIVFWLDNAIPLEYRDAVKEGLLKWNKAYEKLGIKDAIVVKQMPDNADWDHADMRYNTIRWVLSPDNGYAVAQFRVNPITGQILNANITVDANLIRYTRVEKSFQVDPSSYFADRPQVDLKALLNPKKALLQCDMAQGAVEQAWFGYEALSMIDPAWANLHGKEYTQNFISMVVSHEMGHIMGLRHNFIASTLYSMDQLKNEKALAETGVTSSVMDYMPFNISALKTPGVDYFSRSVGPYDCWAIQYGYSPTQAATPQADGSRLQQIASHANEPGHAYQSDEIADQFDPTITRFDLGANPLDYWQRMFDVSRYLLTTLPQREPKPGQNYFEFTKKFSRLLNMYARSAAITSRYVGGLHVRRVHKGDPGEKPSVEPISNEEQKRALSMLNSYVFSETAFAMPKSTYGKLSSDPYPDMIMAILGGASMDAPIRDTLSNIQLSALRRLFMGSVLKRIANNEFKAGGDPMLTLPDLFSSVGTNVWSELEGRRNVSPLRRQLQRAHLDTLIGLFVNPSSGAPEDARSLAWDQLRKLKRRIASGRSGHEDAYTRVHLDESLMKIDRALDAKVVIGSPAAARSQSLLEMLGLGEDKKPQ